jgi:glycosyltransferase involved in cell wall biosynthesis
VGASSRTESVYAQPTLAAVMDREVRRSRGVRVLVVIDALRRAGAENVVVGLARAAPAAGIDLGVVSLQPWDEADSVAAELRAAGASVRSIDASRLIDPAATWRLMQVVRRGAYDVVHAHLEYAAIIGPIAARLAGCPVVTTFHHVPGSVALRDRAKEALAVWVANGCGRVVAVSEAQHQAFHRRYPRSSQRWMVLPNGIDLEEFLSARRSPRPEAIRLLVGGAPAVALVARVRPGKGHELALGAWPRVLERVPGARLVIVGDGSLRAELEQRADELGIARCVAFTGTRRDVPVLVGGVDLVVLPSETEALPTTLIEAAAAGTAAVATSVGGVAEVLVDGETGLLVPPGDQDAFADAVASLLLDDDRRAIMGTRARERAIAGFDVHGWAARLAALYRDVAVPTIGSHR